MFKRKPKTDPSALLLMSTQDIRWSQPQILSTLSQLLMLLIGMFIVFSVIIDMGEKRLQEDWAEHRYSELQTLGSLAADRVSFLKFRSQTFANNELLQQYVKSPTTNKKASVLKNWSTLTRNIPELLGLALYDKAGKLVFSSSKNFQNTPLPESILTSKSNMGGNDIYTSAMDFIPIDGRLEPYIYQVAWLENPDQSVNGYLVTFNSITSLVAPIKSSFLEHQSPLLLLDSQGFLYAGESEISALNNLPDTLGTNIKQTYPKLWQTMAMSNFGQFHDLTSTYVYLKVELTNQYDVKREYFLLSYIQHKDIEAQFNQWKLLLVLAGVIISCLASLLIIFRQLYKLEHEARQNSIQLASGLFNSNISCLIVNDNGRIVSANDQASKVIMQPVDELCDRSLIRVLNFTDEQFADIKQALDQHGHWQGEVRIAAESHYLFKTHIRTEINTHTSERYWLVTFEDITALLDSQNQANLYQQLSNNAVATALTDANGKLLKVNAQFEQMMALVDATQLSLPQLLGDDLSVQWQSIIGQISLQGEWSSQIMPLKNSHFDHCLKATINGQQSVDGEIEHLVCTFEKVPTTAIPKALPVQHRNSNILRLSDLEHHFINLPESTKQQSSLLVLDIDPEDIFTHMGDISLLEKRHQDIELALVKKVPIDYLLVKWQLGKLIILMPHSTATQTHSFAIMVLEHLNVTGLDTGVNIGIASYIDKQPLDAYLANANIALKRAKQSNDQNICQAFTRK